jgi:predicted transcriptional regulator
MVTRKSFFTTSLVVLTFIHDDEATDAGICKLAQISQETLNRVIKSLKNCGLLREIDSQYELTSKGLNVVQYYKENSDSTSAAPMIRLKPQ